MSSTAEFVPNATTLARVGLTADLIADDQALVATAKSLDAAADQIDWQRAVIVYIAIKRGHDWAWVLKEIGWTENTARRRYIEGIAIVRTNDPARAVNAVRGVLTEDDVNTATSKGTAAEKLERLEALAVAKRLKGTMVNADGTEPSDEQIKTLLESAKERVTANDDTTSATTLVEYIKNDDATGLVAKKRTPGDPGDSGPFGLEYHMKAALKDLKQIVADSDGEAYVPTAEDMRALMEVMDYIRFYDLAAEGEALLVEATV
jgi:hypothetical protein